MSPLSFSGRGGVGSSVFGDTVWVAAALPPAAELSFKVLRIDNRLLTCVRNDDGNERVWRQRVLGELSGVSVCQLKEGVGRGHSPWPTVAENGPNTQCMSADSDLSNWEKYKPQVVRVPNAVAVVYIVNWQVQRQAIVKTHRVGPRGPTTRERERVWPIYGVILNVEYMECGVMWNVM